MIAAIAASLEPDDPTPPAKPEGAAAAQPTSRRRIGEPEHPAVLLLGTETDFPTGVVDTIKNLAPRWELRSSLDLIRQAEWDVIVWAGHATTNAHAPVDAPLNVIDVDRRILAFVDLASDSVGLVDGGIYPRRHYGNELKALKGEPAGPAEDTVEFEVQVRGANRCTVFLAADSADPVMNRLVEESLIPAAQRRPVYNYLHVVGAGWTPIGMADDGQPLAIRYERHSHTLGHLTWGDVVMLPADVPAPDRWVRWALDHWRRQDPARFANLRTWTNDPRWRTPDEAAAADQRAAFEAGRSETLARLDADSDALSEREAVADADAASGARRLLTDDGDPLKGAVIDALTALGFEVIDADTLPGRDQAGLEDLQITDSDDPDWIALAEVKGHTKGAQSSVLQSMRNYRDHYREAQGVWPSACWYIANQARTTDPSTRTAPLASHPNSVTIFTGIGGAVVDTRTLFTLVRRFAGASSEQLSELRRQLRSATGVWPFEDDEVWSP